MNFFSFSTIIINVNYLRERYYFHYLYKITNINNNNYYYGVHSTRNLADGYMGGGVRIENSIKKHGLECHKKDILEFFDDRISLLDREREIVNESLLKDPQCLNLQPGGGGGISSKDHMKNFSYAGNKAFKEKLKNPEYRENFIKSTEDSLKKAREKYRDMVNDGLVLHNTFGGRNHTEKSILLISEKAKGRGEGEKNSQFGTCWVYNDEKKINKKISKNDIGKYITDGWKPGLKMDFFKK